MDDLYQCRRSFLDRDASTQSCRRGLGQSVDELIRDTTGWVYVATSADKKENYFVYKQSYEIKDQEVTRWVRIDYKQKVVNGVLQLNPTVKELLKFDCSNNKFKLISFYTYNSKGKNIDKVTTPPPNSLFLYIPPNSIIQSVCDYVCEEMATERNKKEEEPEITDTIFWAVVSALDYKYVGKAENQFWYLNNKPTSKSGNIIKTDLMIYIPDYYKDGKSYKNVVIDETISLDCLNKNYKILTAVYNYDFQKQFDKIEGFDIWEIKPKSIMDKVRKMTCKED